VIHTAGFNLGVLMRRLIGVGTLSELEEAGLLFKSNDTASFFPTAISPAFIAPIGVVLARGPQMTFH
jgi:hypothetical protein